MAWNGYFKFGDEEIINLARTLAYARALNLGFVRQEDDNIYLGPLLGQTYTDPGTDGAPWVDPDEPASAGFAGIIPVDISGIEDSSRQSEIFEFTRDGGNPGHLRHSTKQVVFSVALVGASEGAVEYGFRWLKRALLARNCTPGVSSGSCRGLDLTYAQVEPHSTNISVFGAVGEEWDDILDGGDPFSSDTGTADGGSPGAGQEDLSDEWSDFERHLRNVLVNKGPSITRKKPTTCGGAVWLVTFTAVAGDPFEYGPLTPVLEGFGDGTSPYAGTLTGDYGTTTYEEQPCAVPVYTPIFDPLCPALTPPPPPPDIASGCFEIVTGEDWSREYAEIPADLIPLWDEVRPVLTFRTDADEARMVRVRFYDGTADPAVECDAVGEFVISYIPPFHTLIVDTVAQAVYAYSGDNVVRRADSLVYGDGNARPIKWFGLSCGESYTMTMDRLTADIDPVEIDLALAPRSA